MRPLLHALTAQLAALLVFGAAGAAEPPDLEITAQGFDMGAPQEARLGTFGRLRIRIEAAEGIETLLIRERSYEVDLATTLDEVNYRLFGIEKRVRLHKDVTLNLQSYLNEKLDRPGRYELLIRVRDTAGQEVSETLVAVATAPAETRLEQRVVPLKSGSFTLQRAGAGPVKGGEEFGLSWKTVDAVDVTIRVAAGATGTSIVGEVPAAAYQRFKTRGDLTALFDSLPKDSASGQMDLPTAGNAATGRVLAVETANRYYLIRLNSSTTSVSDIGTTVTLTGEYKLDEK